MEINNDRKSKTIVIIRRIVLTVEFLRIYLDIRRA